MTRASRPIGPGLRRIAALVGATAVVVVANAGPAWANRFSAQGETEGPVQIQPGDWVAGGYKFTIPVSHAADTVGFPDTQIALPVSCSQTTTPQLTIAIPLSGGPYNIAADDHSMVPADNQSDPVTFEGSVQAPDLCNGGPMYHVEGAHSLNLGFFATGDLQATQSAVVDASFHWRDPNAKGFGNINCADPTSNPYPADNGPCGASWAGPANLTPDVTSTPMPVGAAGALGMTAVVGAGLAVLQARRRPQRRRLAA